MNTSIYSLCVYKHSPVPCSDEKTTASVLVVDEVGQALVEVSGAVLELAGVGAVAEHAAGLTRGDN